jgi:hypothetical protein
VARIRTIKPSFFLNEDLSALPYEWRLLFIGLWTQADKAGRLEDRPARLKAMLFPYDDLDVNDGLRRLDAAGLITRYDGNGLRLIAIPKWAKHQQPHVKETESELPPPDTAEHGASTVLAPQEGKGAGTGKERISRADARVEFASFWEIYPRKVGKDGALKAFERINPDHDTVEAMIAAVHLQAQRWSDPKFIPHPMTWLNQGRWKDEEPMPVKPAPARCQNGHEPPCRTHTQCRRLLEMEIEARKRVAS